MSSSLIPRQLQQTLGCQIYSLPTSNQIIQAYDDSILRWNPACLGAEQTIDIYLQSLDAAQPIHVWKSVITSSAQLKTQLIPDWWNNSQSATLQLVITPQDQPAWAGLGPGPVFYAHFNGSTPTDASAQSASHSVKQSGRLTYEFITKLVHRSHGLSGGKLGAAIFLPLLAVAAAIAAFVLISRRRAGEASKRWSQFVDQRMSQIGSQSWEAAAPPSIRGVPGSRVASMYRHSASLPPRASFMANGTPRMSIHSSPNPRISAYSLALPPRPPTNYSRNSRVVSFVDPAPTQKSPSHKSSLSISTSSRPNPELVLSPSQQTGPDALSGPFALPPSPAKSVFRPGHQQQASMARSTSNLRFEIEEDPVIMSAVSLMMSGSTKADASSASSTSSSKTKKSTPDSQTSSGLKVETSSLGAGNASGMRRLAVRTSILSPDEALRQYTLDRERAPDGAAAGPVEMKVLHNNPDVGGPFAMDMPPSRAALQSVYTEASRYSTASAEEAIPPIPNVGAGKK